MSARSTELLRVDAIRAVELDDHDIDVRECVGIEMGTRVNTIRVMAKPLAGGTIPQYLALVARDRPE